MVARKEINTRYLDKQTLMTLGLFDDVAWMFNNIGWQQILDITPPTYIPLTLEFFSSVKVSVSNYA